MTTICVAMLFPWSCLKMCAYGEVVAAVGRVRVSAKVRGLAAAVLALIY